MVVPTSTRRAPLWRSTSGIRKPPPISTACPRETITSRSFAKAERASRTALALLFTARASSAPVRRRSRSGDVVVAGSPRPLLEPVLQVAVPGGHLEHRPEGFVAQGRAAQVGVDDDAGGVDEGAEGGTHGCLQPLRCRLDDVAGAAVSAVPQCDPGLVQGIAQRLDHHLPGELPRQGLHRGVPQEAVHAGQPA